MEPRKISESELESMNNALMAQFGIETISGRAIWKLVWSNDEMEKRYGTFEDRNAAGDLIRRVTETRVVPKYRQWNPDKYILERLVLVPKYQQEELAGATTSYEPIFTMMDKNGEYLPPRLDVCQFVIHSVYAAQGKAPVPIKDYDPNDKNGLEAKKKRIDDIMEYFYGNDTDLQQNLKFGHAVSMSGLDGTSKKH